MELVTIWYYIYNSGDGCAYPQWFLTEEDTLKADEQDDERWAELCNGSITTIKGCREHLKAIGNSFKLNNPDKEFEYLVPNPITLEPNFFDNHEDMVAFAKEFEKPGLSWADMYSWR